MRDFDFDAYEKRCETTKEIKEFLKSIQCVITVF